MILRQFENTVGTSVVRLEGKPPDYRVTNASPILMHALYKTNKFLNWR